MPITTGHWPKIKEGAKMAKSKKDKNVGVEIKVGGEGKYPVKKVKKGKGKKKGK